MNTFDLKVGDIVNYRDINHEKVTKAKYEITAIYKHIFVIKNLSGNHREIGLPKGLYYCGEVKKAEKKGKKK